MSLPFLNTAPARTSATRWGALTARHRVCADSMSLNAIATPAAREPGPLVTRWLFKPELARKFHDNAVRSLPEERVAEIAARTLALPDAQSVEDLSALLTLAGGALRLRQLPLTDCVGQVGHPLCRLRADRLQGHAARVHALEQADSGAEQHGWIARSRTRRSGR